MSDRTIPRYKEYIEQIFPRKRHRMFQHRWWQAKLKYPHYHRHEQKRDAKSMQFIIYSPWIRFVEQGRPYVQETWDKEEHWHLKCLQLVYPTCYWIFRVHVSCQIHVAYKYCRHCDGLEYWNPSHSIVVFATHYYCIICISHQTVFSA